jgi:hypothetical protein
MKYAALFVVYFALIAALVVPAPVIYDSDSYYHLAVARLYATDGVFAKIPWARMSLLGAGGDKDFLFHVALIPFATFGANGGRVALALINALIATLIAAIAMQRIGFAGAFVPPWLWIAAPPFLGRMLRLRPELFALAILIAAVIPSREDGAGSPHDRRKRGIRLGILAVLFTLSYTAWHVFLALCVFWWLTESIVERYEIQWPIAGTIAGLFIRPHPIANLHVWYVQNVEFFLRKGSLDVGTEITPPDSWYFTSAMFFFAMLIVLKPLKLRNRRLMIAAAIFVILFVFMSRMAVYAFPLVALLVIVDADVHPRAYAIAFTICTLLALPLALDSYAIHLLRTRVQPEAEWRAFGASVPRDAKIASDWQSSEHYAFFAPQGRYLNVLDPVFMALPHPREYDALRRVMSGADPDPATTLATQLDSDYIAYSAIDVPPVLNDRVHRDPRFVVVRDGINVLARVKR